MFYRPIEVWRAGDVNPPARSLDLGRTRELTFRARPDTCMRTALIKKHQFQISLNRVGEVLGPVNDAAADEVANVRHPMMHWHVGKLFVIELQQDVASLNLES